MIFVNINEFEVNEPELVESIDQVSLDFDMPLEKQMIIQIK